MVWKTRVPSNTLPVSKKRGKILNVNSPKCYTKSVTSSILVWAQEMLQIPHLSKGFSLPDLWCQVLSFARSSSCENLAWLGFAGSQQSEEAPGYWRHGTEMRLVLYHFLVVSLLMRKKNHHVATTNWLHIVLRRRALPQPISYLHENLWPGPSAGLMNLQDCEEE